jgi:hypothetical protein
MYSISRYYAFITRITGSDHVAGRQLFFPFASSQLSPPQAGVKHDR